MSDIKINQIDSNTYQIVIAGSISTTHLVTVLPEYAQKLTKNQVSTNILLEKSFEFLLARESNTSILRSFDLNVISRYFPEYENEIKRILS